MSQQKYRQTVNTIAEIFQTAREESETAGSMAMTLANWQIGEQIVTLEQDGDIRAPYGGYVIETLSEQLNTKFGKGFSTRNLRMMRLFYHTYKKNKLRRELSWSHYIQLLGISEDSRRKAMETRVLREKLTVTELTRLLKARNNVQKKQDRPNGTLHTYRLTKKSNLSTGKNATYLDLGFGIYSQDYLSEISDTKDAKIFTLTPNAKRYDLTPANTTDQYFFRAYPERIVDGDTVILKVDLAWTPAPDQNPTQGSGTHERGTEQERKGSRDAKVISEFSAWVGSAGAFSSLNKGCPGPGNWRLSGPGTASPRKWARKLRSWPWGPSVHFLNKRIDGAPGSRILTVSRVGRIPKRVKSSSLAVESENPPGTHLAKLCPQRFAISSRAGTGTSPDQRREGKQGPGTDIQRS